ncbi:MAG: MFS transporter [Candidatus Bipolaricaulota bacterium]|nr:MAG: MFS transporter [Candidatus Bipolaricaulota bacterium]
MTARWKRNFFTIWIGQQLSLVGSRAAQFALVWWLTTTTGSATVLATATMVALLPQILLGPFAGAYVDRWNRRRVMMVADGFIALVALWLALMFWSGAIQVWHLYVALLARSLGEAFHWPAMAASTTLMVPEKHLARIGGLNQAVHGVLNVVGAPLGALLLSLLPLHGVMFVDVATAAFAVLPLVFIMIPQPERREALAKPTVWRDVREGLVYLRGWRGMVILLSGIMLLKIAMTPAFSLMPLLVRSHFGRGATDLALLEAVAGIGIIVGGLTLTAWGGFRRKIYTALMSLVGIGIALIGFGVAPASLFWVAVGVGGLLGFAIPFADGTFIAVLQSTVAPAVQGRVFGLIASLSSLTSPVGLALAGPITDLLGLQIWYLVAGVVCLAQGVAFFFVPSVLQIENHRAEEAPDASPEAVADAPAAFPS